GVWRIAQTKRGYATVVFNPSVFREPPFGSDDKLLALTQVQRVDSPLDRVRRCEWDEPWRFELKTQAARFLCGNSAGQLSNARIEILPHQVFAVHRVVSSERRRFLIVNESLIDRIRTAGLIWLALDGLRKANRTLIITRPELSAQWQEVLQADFGVRFEIFGRDFTAVNPWVWDVQARAIASPQRLQSPINRRVLLDDRKWNLIIFDEAHRLSAVAYGSEKVEKTLNYRLAEELRNQSYSEALLLLTATPHQGEENHSRFKNLLYLLEDEIDFSGLEELNLFSGSGTRFTELVIRTPKKDVTDAEGRRVFRGRQTHRMPFEMYGDEARFYKAVAKYIQGGYKMLDRLNDPARR
ncbi:MAG: DEAD/DEAH box helicase family protein, partial [Candidatus Saccharimonadales bacterium]